MIDIENKVFTRISEAIKAEYQTANVKGEYVHEPSSFPHVSVVEADNYTDQTSLPLSNSPAAARLMYEVNVHSNSSSNRKQECKNIMKIVDDSMEDMGFVRTFMNRVSNLESATIYRIVARYSKLQPKGGNV